jgi:hypothetical protein
MVPFLCKMQKRQLGQLHLFVNRDYLRGQQFPFLLLPCSPSIPAEFPVEFFERDLIEPTAKDAVLNPCPIAFEHLRDLAKPLRIAHIITDEMPVLHEKTPESGNVVLQRGG